MDLYIYYRVLPANAQALQARLSAMLQGLLMQHGVHAGLKRRPEETDGRQTWMEVYFQVPVGFAALLDHALEQADVAGLIEGQRHTEIFVDIQPCA